jgi:hypothetical protein
VVQRWCCGPGWGVVRITIEGSGGSHVGVGDDGSGRINGDVMSVYTDSIGL